MKLSPTLTASLALLQNTLEHGDLTQFGNIQVTLVVPEHAETADRDDASAVAQEHAAPPDGSFTTK
jgi:hypothetical protein